MHIIHKVCRFINTDKTWNILLYFKSALNKKKGKPKKPQEQQNFKPSNKQKTK